MPQIAPNIYLIIFQETKELRNGIFTYVLLNLTLNLKKNEQCESSIKVIVTFKNKNNVENEIFKLKVVMQIEKLQG